MRAVTLKNGEIALREIPTPVPGAGQVLARVLACAICASDHHFMDHPEVAEQDQTRMRVSAPDQDVVMGHEFCAEIVEYGPETNQAWPVGTRVTSVPALFTADGMRVIGMAPDAPGGFGEYLLLTEGLIVPLPEELPVERLALIDAMAVGWYYTRLGTTTPEGVTTVPIVIGLGAIGLSVVTALKQRGHGPIIAADYSASRRELAQQLGADIVVDPAVQSPWEAWRQAAWGAPEDVFDRMTLSGLAKCVAYEAVGVGGVLSGIIDDCPIGTRIYSAGGAASDTITSSTAHTKGINLQFGGGPEITDWMECAQLVASGAIDPTPLIGETVTLDGLADAFERARDSSGPVRIVWLAEPAGTSAS